MPRKFRGKHRRSKHSIRKNINQPDVEEQDEIVINGEAEGSLNNETETEITEHKDKISINDASNSELSSDLNTGNKKTDGKQLTNIFERIQSQIKLDAGPTIVQILETLLKIDDCAEKRDLRYELLKNYIHNLQECDLEEVMQVSRNTRSFFMSKEFKKLLVDDKSVEQDRVIGSGSFGLVTVGYLKRPAGTKVKVAIKEVSSEIKQYLINEAEIMVQLDHENIVKILAFQIGEESRLIMEYFVFGNLIECISRHKCSDERLLQFIMDIASGMEYMTAKQIVHCDLACRNVFVNRNWRCKIGDFGLSHYVGDTDGVYDVEPLERFSRLLPPEARKAVNPQFSWKTDMWTTGVLIWQLFYFAKVSMCLPSLLYLQMLDINEITTLPQQAIPRVLYKYLTAHIMNTDPDKRPTFAMIKNKISEMM